MRGLPLPCAAPQTSKASPRRNLRLLEVGAINTQLLDAASKPGVRLSVRALDLRSTDPRIEAADFSALPVPEPPEHDALMCSMVLNCAAACCCCCTRSSLSRCRGCA